MIMSRIKIKNLGPIKEGYTENGGWLDVKKVTVFIGNQGSGKSTIAKVISTLSWLEKSINRGDTDKSKLSFAKFKEFFKFQKIYNYFSKSTFIEYFGEKYHIVYDTAKEYPIIKEVQGEGYNVPKIMYIPAERNFLSTISEAFGIKELPEDLFIFAQELKKAQQGLSGKKLKLPIGNYTYEYEKNTDFSYISGPDYRINLLEASSGLQSFVPLYLVSRNLSRNLLKKSEYRNLSVTQSMRMDEEISEIILNDLISNEVKNIEIKKIRNRYFSKCFLNIVEEPEQNLYPASQRQMLNSLFEINNMDEGNKLIITTHSPYLINYLTLAIKADMLKKKVNEENISKLKKIVPLESTVKSDEIIIYELTEGGTIKKLKSYNGLPSDENKLNTKLEESNDLFAQLLEIQQSL
jgi:predicted ATPase